MRTLAELQKLRAELSNRFKTVTASVENETPTEEQDKELSEIHSEIEAVAGEIASIEAKREAYKSSLAATSKAFNASDIKPHTPTLPSAYNPDVIAKSFAKRIENDAKGLSSSARKVFKDSDIAARAGQFFGALKGDTSCREAIGATFIEAADPMNPSSNQAGGYLVPTELMPTLIDLREQYGVFRREAQVLQVSAPAGSMPRVTGDLDGSFVGMERNDAVTDDAMTFDNIAWSLRTYAARTRTSFEMERDSVINIAALVMNKMAYDFSKQEDRAGFIGDGTSTYGGMQGVLHKLSLAAHAGSVQTAGSGEVGFGTTKIDTILNALGKIAAYAHDAGNIKFYISQPGYFALFSRLKQSSSGNLSAGNTAVIAEGQMRFLWNGYPIVISHVLPSALTSTTDNYDFFVGDLRQGAMLAEDPQILMARLGERYLDEGNIGYVGFHRFDVNVHEVGNTTEAGSLVAIRFAAS